MPPEALSFSPEFSFGQQEIKHRFFRSLREFLVGGLRIETAQEDCCSAAASALMLNKLTNIGGSYPKRSKLSSNEGRRQPAALEPEAGASGGKRNFGNKRCLPSVSPRVRLPLP